MICAMKFGILCNIHFSIRLCLHNYDSNLYWTFKMIASQTWRIHKVCPLFHILVNENSGSLSLNQFSTCWYIFVIRVCSEGVCLKFGNKAGWNSTTATSHSPRLFTITFYFTKATVLFRLVNCLSSGMYHTNYVLGY